MGNSDGLQIVATIFGLIIVLVFVVPPLATQAFQLYPTVEKDVKNVAEQLCQANEKLEKITEKWELEIINSIPVNNEKAAIAKENVIKLYNDWSLTPKQLKTLKDIPKYYKYKLDIHEIENEITQNPVLLCDILK